MAAKSVIENKNASAWGDEPHRKRKSKEKF